MSKTLESLAEAVERMTQARADRDRLVVEARREGVTWRQISAASGLTELSTRQIATRTNDGVLPVPADASPAKKAPAKRAPRKRAATKR